VVALLLLGSVPLLIALVEVAASAGPAGAGPGGDAARPAAARQPPLAAPATDADRVLADQFAAWEVLRTTGAPAGQDPAPGASAATGAAGALLGLRIAALEPTAPPGQDGGAKLPPPLGLGLGWSQASPGQRRQGAGLPGDGRLPPDPLAGARVLLASPSGTHAGAVTTGPDDLTPAQGMVWVSLTSAIPGPTQPPLFALVYRGSQLGLGLIPPNHLPLAVVNDTLLQAMLRQPTLDNPFGNLAVQWLMTGGALFGEHYLSRWFGGWWVTRVGRQNVGPWFHTGTVGGHYFDVTMAKPGLQWLLTGGLLGVEGLGKLGLQQIGVLSPPLVTAEGQRLWARAADYWWNLVYDVGFQTAFYGLVAGLTTETPFDYDRLYRSLGKAGAPIPPLRSILDAERRALLTYLEAVGRDLHRGFRLGFLRFRLDLTRWQRALDSAALAAVEGDLHRKYRLGFPRFGLGLTRWRTALASAALAGVSRLLSEAELAPPGIEPPHENPGAPGQALREPSPDSVVEQALSWAANSARAGLTAGLDLTLRNAPWWGSVPLYGERLVLAVRSEWAEVVEGRIDEARRLGNLPAMHAFSPGVHARVSADLDRASQAMWRAVHAPTPGGTFARALHVALNALDLADNLADAVAARFGATPTDPQAPSRQERLALALERADGDLARIGGTAAAAGKDLATGVAALGGAVTTRVAAAASVLTTSVAAAVRPPAAAPPLAVPLPAVAPPLESEGGAPQVEAVPAGPGLRLGALILDASFTDARGATHRLLFLPGGQVAEVLQDGTQVPVDPGAFEADAGGTDVSRSGTAGPDHAGRPSGAGEVAAGSDQAAVQVPQQAVVPSPPPAGGGDVTADSPAPERPGSLDPAPPAAAVDDQPDGGDRLTLDASVDAVGG